MAKKPAEDTKKSGSSASKTMRDPKASKDEKSKAASSLSKGGSKSGSKGK